MTRHVPVPPRRPEVLGRGKLEFRWEPFSAIARDLPPLFKQHWRELAVDQQLVSLDPDWAAYYDLELRGVLHVLVARDGVLNLVGYVFNLIGGHLHYVGTRFAHTEMFWLHPDYRRGWEPVRMLKENIAGLREREAVISTINFKLGFKDARVGKLLARLGYAPTDIVMRKVL